METFCSFPLCPETRAHASVSRSVLLCSLFVGRLINIPATCLSISGTDLLRQFYVLPQLYIEVADQTCHLTKSQYTDTGPTSSSTNPMMPGAWQGSHWRANFEVTGMTQPGKIQAQVGFEYMIFHSRGRLLNRNTNKAIYSAALGLVQHVF